MTTSHWLGIGIRIITGNNPDYHLDVSVDVKSVILAGEDDTAILHQGNIEALSMLDLALESTNKLPSLGEDSQVEVVVVVSDGNLAASSDSDSNWEVGDSLTTNLPKIISLIVEHFDAVSAIVRDENLHLIVNHNTVGKLQVPRAGELVEHVADHVEDDNSHHLALDNHNTPPIVHLNKEDRRKEQSIFQRFLTNEKWFIT